MTPQVDVASNDGGNRVTVDEELPEALGDQRVDRIITIIADVSRAEASRLVADGHVSVDAKPVSKPSMRVKAGSRIHFTHDPTPPPVTPDPTVELDIVYVDDHVIVVDKQAGLVVHPASGTQQSTLVHGLLDRYPDIAGVGPRERPGVVHRLDRGTSGLLMVARTSDALVDLSDQLKARTVERRYRTVVIGHLESPSGLIDAPLGRSRRDRALRSVVADGRPALTYYEVLALRTSPSGLAVTELACRLETGRTHQIRAHLSAIGHPVLGDQRYGGGIPPQHQLGSTLNRPFLHAETLGFDHPETGEMLRFSAPLPKDLEVVLNGLAEVAD